MEPRESPLRIPSIILSADLTRDLHARERAIEAGFDVRTSAEFLQNFYLEQYAIHSGEETV